MEKEGLESEINKLKKELENKEKELNEKEQNKEEKSKIINEKESLINALKEENLCLVNQYAIFNCGKLCNYYETPM